MTLQNGFSRNNISVDLDGEGAELTLCGMVIGDGEQHTDNHTVVNHNVPNCVSKELFKYVLNDDERDAYLATLPANTKYEIGRMKGLGEMDPEELRETTMGIDKRVLKQVTMDDAILADETFQLLMGEEVEPRRQFIEENAIYVKNLDV
mgnify:CR=1 FL=1